MKKLMTTIGIGLMIALISPAIAQDGKKAHNQKEHKDLTPEERAKKHTDRMTTDLGLSAEQAKQIYTINLNNAKEMEAIKIEKDKLKKRAKVQKDKSKTEIDKVLTPEQKVKMEELKKEREEKRKVNKGEHSDDQPRPPKPKK